MNKREKKRRKKIYESQVRNAIITVKKYIANDNYYFKIGMEHYEDHLTLLNNLLDIVQDLKAEEFIELINIHKIPYTGLLTNIGHDNVKKFFDDETIKAIIRKSTLRKLGI